MHSNLDLSIYDDDNDDEWMDNQNEFEQRKGNE